MLFACGSTLLYLVTVHSLSHFLCEYQIACDMETSSVKDICQLKKLFPMHMILFFQKCAFMKIQDQHSVNLCLGSVALAGD